jgi:2-oxo-3-hexenedioate decarboxylase
MKTIEKIAEEIHLAAINANEIEQISLSQTISLSDAYNIQELAIQHRFNEGETLIGLKMGFTPDHIVYTHLLHFRL